MSCLRVTVLALILVLILVLVGASGCSDSGSDKASPTAQPAAETTQPVGQLTQEAPATPTPQTTPAEAYDGRILANIPLFPGGANFSRPNGIAINLATDRLYIAFRDTQNIAVLDSNTYEVIAAIDLGLEPAGDFRWPSEVAVDPSRNRIYVGIQGVDPEVVVLDGRSNTITNRFSQIGYPVSLAVNAVTARLYVAHRRFVTVFDIQSGVRVADIPLEEDPDDVAVNVATNRVYVAHYWGDSISVIDGNSNQVVKAVEGVEWAARVAADPNGNRVYVSCVESIVVLDGTTEEVIDEIELAYFFPGDLTVHPDTGLVYALDDTKLLVLDGRDGTVVDKRVVTEIFGGEGSLAIDYLTNRLYVIHFVQPRPQDVLRVVDIAGNTIGRMEAVPLGSKPVDVVLSRNGKKLYVANSSADVVSVVDAATNKLIRNVGVGVQPTRLAIDQDANEVYVVTRTGLYVIDGTSDSVVAVVELGGNPHNIALDPKADRVYVTELKPGDGGIRVIDTRTRTLVQRLADPFAPFALFCDGIAANPRTDKLYVGHLTGGKVSPVISSIEPVPSGLRLSVTGWTQEGGALTGGITVFDGITLKASTRLVLPVYHYGVPVAVDESTNRIYAALNVGALSAVGLDQQIGLTVIDGTNDVVTEVLVPSEEVSSFFANIRDMATDPTRSRLVMTAQNDAILVIDTEELAVESLINLPPGSIPEGLAIDPESGKIYVANSGNGTISVIDIT